jgi:Tol biopolymer transport system component/DNA-binding winged helix-turn-helix (wHTH) protein
MKLEVNRDPSGSPSDRTAERESVLHFGSFELNPRSGELRKKGVRISLQEQPLRVLVALLEHPGRLVTREELRERIWPGNGFGDFDHAINLAVGKLRNALGDSAKVPRLIETFPRRGYRFLAPVEERPALHTKPSAPVAPPFPVHGAVHARTERNRLGILLACGVLVSLVVAGIIYRVWRPSQVRPLLKARQLTRNSFENVVRSGAISPDGKYLAYADVKGMHIQLIATHETLDIQPTQLLANTQVYWEVRSWLPDSTRFVANARTDQSHFSWNAANSSVWEVSLVGTMHKLRDEASALSVSPDGAWIAFAAGPPRHSYQDVWLMGTDGGQPHKLFSTDPNTAVRDVVWSPDGKRIAYVRFDNLGTALALESRGLTGAPASEIVQIRPTAPPAGLQWLPDGRIAYTLLQSGTGVRECAYWELAVDAGTGKPVTSPEQVTGLLPGCPSSISYTADGKHLAVLQGSDRYTIYTANLAINKTRLNGLKQLTLDESRNIPSGWTPDSRTLIFISDRNGPREIFRQSVDEGAAQSIFTQPGIGGAARLTSDGSSVLYVVRDPALVRKKLMRIRLTGGEAPEELLSGRLVDGGARCATPPASLCVIAERSPDQRQLIFRSIDPSNGHTQELGTFATDSSRNLDYFWDLSPNGTRVAILNSKDAAIHLYSLSGEPSREITLKGWGGLGYISWMPDGRNVIVGQQENCCASLLSVGMAGDVHVLWKQNGGVAISGIPSPDGRRIAIWLWTMNDNFWILDNP